MNKARGRTMTSDDKPCDPCHSASRRDAPRSVSMTRVSVALAVAGGLGLAALPALALAMGSGGGMSGGGMTAPEAPQYDPAVEYQRGTSDLTAGHYRDAVDEFTHVTDATPRVA